MEPDSLPPPADDRPMANECDAKAEVNEIEILRRRLVALDSKSVIPPELQGRVPRDLPRYVKVQLLSSGHWAQLLHPFILGAFCLACSQIPFVQVVAIYFTPLDYVYWIGFAIWVFGFGLFLFNRDFRSASRYITHGQAAVGIVTEIRSGASALSNNQPISAAIFATAFVQHPESGRYIFRKFESLSFGLSEQPYVKPRFEVGAATAVVWHPNQFETTAQLYDFLELTPTASLIHPPRHWLYDLITPAICLAVLYCLWISFVAIRYYPLDFDYRSDGLWPIAFGLLLGLIELSFIVIVERRKLRRDAAAIEAAGVSAPLSSFLTGNERSILNNNIATLVVMLAICFVNATLLVFSFAFYLNAANDTSPAVPQSVHIETITPPPDRFALDRSYNMRYRLDNDENSTIRLFHSTPEQLAQFPPEFNELPAVAQTRAGYFGWHWVQSIDPIGAAAK